MEELRQEFLNASVANLAALQNELQTAYCYCRLPTFISY